MSDIYLIRVPLTKEEINALQYISKIECRLDYEQIRFTLRAYLIRIGALPATKTLEPPNPPKGAIS